MLTVQTNGFDMREAALGERPEVTRVGINGFARIGTTSSALTWSACRLRRLR
jgi:hypothetical protein